MKTIRFTKEGYEKLQEELKGLKEGRPEAVADLKKARDMGDLSENGYYKAAKFKLNSIDRSIRILTYQLKQGSIVGKTDNTSIDVGSRVVVTDGEKRITYEVVGDTEAEPLKGRISLLSPIGRALNGKKIGDKVIIEIPKGKITYSILQIS